MIPAAWIEKQVFSLSLAELKSCLGRKRLRIDRWRLLGYVLALMEQQARSRHYKAIHRDGSVGVGYAAFMHGMAMAAPLWGLLLDRHQSQQGIVFDDLTLADSSLLPSKDEGSISKKDWLAGRATVRPGVDKQGKTRICGEKLMAVSNSRRQLVLSLLMTSINSADDHVFKQPYQWACRGLRKGFLLVDRGFSNRAMRSGFEVLRKTLPGFAVHIISPPRARQTWVLTPEEQQLYKKRWEIEEIFRQLKDPLGRFKLSMKGVRNRKIRAARVAIATLAWNMEHS